MFLICLVFDKRYRYRGVLQGLDRRQRKRFIRDRLNRPLFSLGVDAAKELIYSCLKIEDSGAGYCHFPIGQGYDEEYFEKLTAEKAVTRVRNGVKYGCGRRYGHAAKHWM